MIVLFQDYTHACSTPRLYPVIVLFLDYTHIILQDCPIRRLYPMIVLPANDCPVPGLYLTIALFPDYPTIAVCPRNKEMNVTSFQSVFRNITIGYKLKNGTRRNMTDSYSRLEVLALSGQLVRCQAFLINSRNAGYSLL
jgi:hypothetical protein